MVTLGVPPAAGGLEAGPRVIPGAPPPGPPAAAKMAARLQQPGEALILDSPGPLACGISVSVQALQRTLERAVDGDAQAAGELLPLVYEQLQRLAAHKLAGEAPGQTLEPTALVHEAWLRVAGGRDRRWQGRTHFFSAAAEAMRRILIDNARRKRAIRHGGALHRTELPEDLAIDPPAGEDELLAVHEALDRLAAHDPRKAEVVKLRYFMGLSVEESAEVLGVSEPTIKRDWTYARAWLFRDIQRGFPGRRRSSELRDAS